VLCFERFAFLRVVGAECRFERVERKLRVNRDARTVGHVHDAVGALRPSRVTGRRHLQVVVNVLLQSRRFQHVRELDLTPSAAAIAPPEKLIQAARLFLATTLFREQLFGPALDLTQGADVLFIELHQIALVFVEKVRQRLKGSIECGLSFLHHLFLGLVELLHGTGQHAIGEILKDALHVLEGHLVFFARALHVRSSGEKFGLSNREIGFDGREYIALVLGATSREPPREYTTNDEPDDTSESRDHVPPSNNYSHHREGLSPPTSLLAMRRLFRSSVPDEENSVPLEPESEDLRPQVVRIFALVGEAIAGATHALLSNDRELAKRVVEQDIMIDDLVNELVVSAEARLLDSDALDVEGRRELLILLRIMPEVERNGDLAEHVARRAARGLGSEMSPRSRGLIERMGEVASTIWREATDVIIDGKTEAVGAIEDIDDELDDLHVSLTAELTSGSMSVPVAVEVALMARFYERFGDHCVNLARRQVGRGGAD